MISCCILTIQLVVEFYSYVSHNIVSQNPLNTFHDTRW